MLENKIHLFTLVLFLCLFFLTYLVPIADIDFWWHIASGRYIWEAGSIPSVDPFLVFDDSNVVRSNTILKGYWLGQIALYNIYNSFSEFGVIIFRALILSSCLGFIYLRMRMLKLAGLGLWLSLLVAALVLQGYTGERPQLFSFLFMGLLMLFWDVFQARESKLSLLAIPVLFALWSNFHGGFLLGVVVMSLFVGAKAFSLSKKHEWPRYWAIWGGFILIIVVASLFNPNGIDTYILLFQAQGSEAQSRTSEYMSSLSLYQYGFWFEQVVVWLLLVLVAGAVFTAGKSHDWGKALVMIFLLSISLSASRYLVFLAIVATPYIGQFLISVEKRVTSSINNYHKRLTWLFLVIVSVSLVGYALLYRPVKANDRFEELSRGLMLMKQEQASGLAFNTMNIGGYLLWHMAPDVRPFVDGRMIDEKKLVPYTHILWITNPGKKWFAQNNFDWVVMSTKNQFTGEHYPLVTYLQSQRHWRVLFRTEDWVIFEKTAQLNGAKNKN